MKDRIFKGLSRKVNSIMVRRRRRDSMITKRGRSRRPGRLFQ
ncbi:hypothetical protein GA0070604_0405 [Micromonospora eburnea]|uniref:Uncharacterized protein n=1 Tax=Micromonospora eburnea TaxID=227316 RepID=A0A1C6TS11_9ACTN|nr:hypothetical protein GA0070604_0405 [Micromonospora eburnea]